MDARYGISDNVARTIGREAQRNNLLAVKLVAGIVRTTLGPRGMDKMIVDGDGSVTVTNDGATILREMELDHPAAKMLVDVAKTQEEEVGDGTTTAVILAGALLENAEALLDKKIHPTMITKGYQLAVSEAVRSFEQAAVPVQTINVLKQIAMTAMTGKGVEGVRENLAEVLVESVNQVAEGSEISKSDISFVKIRGEKIEDTSLISGVVLPQGRAHAAMPPKVEKSGILLIDAPLELRSTETEAHISVTSPEQLEQFYSSEEKYLRKMTDAIISSGAKVIFCQKGIDDVAQYYLAQAGILACRRVPRSKLVSLSRATSGMIISNIAEISSEKLGHAEVVEEIEHAGDSFVYVRGCPNPRAVTILVRGGTDHVLAEVERALEDGLGDLVSAVKSGKIVAGGGAVEIEVARKLRQFARSLGGREQLAVEKFAEAIEIVPETLAENAGLDPIDVLTELRKQHEQGNQNSGLNLFTERIENTFAAGIVEPLKIKTQAIQAATETAVMLLRIDDVLVRSRENERKNSGPEGLVE